MKRLIAVVFACILVIGLFAARTEDVPNVPDEMRFETERFQALEWTPRFRSDECYIEYEAISKQRLTDTDTQSLRNFVDGHLYRHEYRAAGYPTRVKNISENSYRIEVRLPDSCNKREEIAAALETILQDSTWLVSIRRNRNPPVEHATADTFAWTDDPDFDPTFWAMKNRAHNGDYDALIWRAVFAEEQQDAPEMAMVLFQWAANCAPDTPRRNIALENLERLSSTSSQETIKRGAEIQSIVHDQMASYGIECLP